MHGVVARASHPGVTQVLMMGATVRAWCGGTVGHMAVDHGRHGPFIAWAHGRRIGVDAGQYSPCMAYDAGLTQDGLDRTLVGLGMGGRTLSRLAPYIPITALTLGSRGKFPYKAGGSKSSILG